MVDLEDLYYAANGSVPRNEQLILLVEAELRDLRARVAQQEKELVAARKVVDEARWFAINRATLATTIAAYDAAVKP